MPRSSSIFALVATGLLLLAAVPFLSGQVQAASHAASHDRSRWQPPGSGHEHGDAPPAWLVDAYRDNPTWAPYWGTGVLYDGPFNTSSAENTVKHTAMKGFRLSYPDFKDRNGKPLDGYLVMHMSSNPMDRGAQFHSARVYIKDVGNGISIRQGWIDAGSVDTARVPKRCTVANGGSDCSSHNGKQRPIVFVVDQKTWDGDPAVGRLPDRQEQWYPIGIGFSFGWGVDPTTIATPDEQASDTNPHEWHGTGAAGNIRSVDVTAGKPGFSGLFWTNQYGVYVADAAGPACQGENICLLQYYAPTYAGIIGGSQRTFPIPADISLPN